MRTENLGFEDCDLNPIFQDLDKPNNTHKKNCNYDSVPSVKAGKLPLPRDLDIGQGSVKVYSYCKIEQDSECPQQHIVKESESHEEFNPSSRSSSKQKHGKKKSHSKHRASEDSLVKEESGDSYYSDKSEKICIWVSDPKLHKKEKHSRKHRDRDSSSSNSSSIRDICPKKIHHHEELSKKESSKCFREKKGLCKGSCEDLCKNDHLKTKCNEYLEKKLSKKNIEDKKSRSQSHHHNSHRKKSTCNDLCKKESLNKLEKECEIHIKRKCSKRHLGDRSGPNANIIRDSSENSKDEEYKSDKNLNKECKKYLEKKISERHLGDKSSSDLSSITKMEDLSEEEAKESLQKRQTCKDSCKKKYLKKACEKYLEEKCLRKYIDKKKSSKSFEKKKTCEDSCKDYYLEECLKYLEKKYSKKHKGGSQSESDTSFPVCPRKKSSHKDLNKQKSSHESEKIKCSCKHLKSSDRKLQRECEKYLARKCSEKDIEDSQSESQTSLPIPPKDKNLDKEKSAKKKGTCNDICKKRYDEKLEKKCKKYLEKKYSKEHVGDQNKSQSKSDTYSNNDRLHKIACDDVCKKEPSPKCLKKKQSFEDFCKERSDNVVEKKESSCKDSMDEYLENECQKYLKKKCTKHRSDDKELDSQTSLASSNINKESSLNDISKKKSKQKYPKKEDTCTDACKEKYLINKCKKYLERKCSKKDFGDSGSQSPLNVLPKKKSSHEDQQKSSESLKKKESRCKDICKEKYLEKKCEKYLERKCSKKHPHDSNVRHEKETADKHSSKDKYIKQECEKYLQKKCCKKHASNDSAKIAASSDSLENDSSQKDKSLEPKKRSHKDTHKNELLEKECKKYLEKKCSKKHIGDSESVSHSSRSCSCPGTKSSHNDLCKKWSECKDKHSHKDIYKKSSKHKKSHENLYENKSSENFKKKGHCDDELCKKWQQYLKLKHSDSDEELCRLYAMFLENENVTHMDLIKLVNSHERKYQLPVLESAKLSSENSKLEDTSTESEDDKKSSQLHMYIISPGRAVIYKSKTDFTNATEQIQKLHPKFENETTLSSIPVPGADPLKSDKTENTVWNNCLSILIGSGVDNKSNVGVATTNSLKSKMDPESGSKKCFTNPSIASKHIDSETELSTQSKDHTAPDSMSKSSTESSDKSKDSTLSNKITIQNEILKKKNEDDNRRNDCEKELLQDVDSRIGRPIPTMVSQVTSSSDEETTKSLTSDHSHTLASVTGKVQDVASKVYETTSEIAVGAITRIQTESSKQLETLKNYQKSEDSLLKQINPSDIESYSEKALQKLIHRIKESRDSELPRRIFDGVTNQVSSAVSLISETVAESMKHRTYNDCSSKYDRPDPNLHGNKLPPEQLSLMVDDDTSTNSTFKIITGKLWSIFNNKDKEEDAISHNTSATSISGDSHDDDAETDEDLMNKLIE